MKELLQKANSVALDKETEGNKNTDVKMNIADSNDQIEPKNSSYSENFDNDAN